MAAKRYAVRVRTDKRRQEYLSALILMAHKTAETCAAIKLAAALAEGVKGADGEAQRVVLTMRAQLLDLLNEVPHMRAVFTVPPLRIT